MLHQSHAALTVHRNFHLDGRPERDLGEWIREVICAFGGFTDLESRQMANAATTVLDIAHRATGPGSVEVNVFLHEGGAELRMERERASGSSLILYRRPTPAALAVSLAS